jgi:hypothetical protein
MSARRGQRVALGERRGRREGEETGSEKAVLLGEVHGEKRGGGDLHYKKERA